jgi:hypothetical protein
MDMPHKVITPYQLQHAHATALADVGPARKRALLSLEEQSWRTRDSGAAS